MSKASYFCARGTETRTAGTKGWQGCENEVRTQLRSERFKNTVWLSAFLFKERPKIIEKELDLQPDAKSLKSRGEIFHMRVLISRLRPKSEFR